MPKDHLLPNIEPLHREPISSSIMNLLAEYLLQRKLKPGDRLPSENELARQLGVGRNSVREATKMLTSLGVIEIRKGVGTFIAKSVSLSIFDPLVLTLVFEQGLNKELAELRLFIEFGLACHIVDRVTDEDIERLEAANQSFKEVAQKVPRDDEAIADTHKNFHHSYIEITRNPYIIKIAKAILILYRSSMAKSAQIAPLQIYENHRLLIEAAKKRDGDQLLKLTKRFMKETIDRIAKANSDSAPLD